MASLSIKDVPDDLAERLRQRAARNHRSLQGELMAIIEQAIHEPAPAPAPAAPRASAASAGVAVRSSDAAASAIEQIAAEHRVRFPQPIRTGPTRWTFFAASATPMRRRAAPQGE